MNRTSESSTIPKGFAGPHRFGEASRHPDEHGGPAGGSLRYQCCNVASVARQRAGTRDVHALRAWRKAQPHRIAVAGRRGVVGIAGAGAGLGLAPVVARTLVRLITNADPGSEPYTAAIDTRVLLFTLTIALVTSLLFSIAPVLHFLRPDVASTLRQNAGTASKTSQRFRKLAVGAQIALSVMLLGARACSCAHSIISATNR